ncbi:MAG: hypothetical protein ABIS36_09705 [Chryseolinea sp.]
MLSTTKKIAHFSLLLVVGIIAMTCGESPDVIPNGQPGPGTPPMTEISDEDRMKVLDEAGKFVELLGDLKSELAQQTLVQWLQTRPEFKEAGISDDDVWASFQDGRLAIFIPKWDVVEEEGGRMPLPQASSAINGEGSATSGRTQGMPQTSTATFFYGLGKIFTDYRHTLKDLFTKSNTSYKVELKDASIENLKAVKDLGIFYIQTHGGTALPEKKQGNGVFGLWTTNPVTPENEKLYRVDHNAARVLYMYALHDLYKPVWHYAITRRFVDEYMTFAENALQYIDGCNGGTLNAIPFRDKIMEKAANGKATYLGWTTPMVQSEGEETSRYFFDRLLGAHDKGIPTESPVQRPFDVAAIVKDLKRTGLGVTWRGGSLTSHTTVDSKAILTPSIEYLTIQDYDSKLFVKGFFGEEPGIVTVDGVAVPVEWTEEVLICQLPDTGPGSSGEVIVSVRGNKSNPVPLSEWNIPLNVSMDQLGMTTEAILYLRVRGDVHSYRSTPGESPRRPLGDSLILEYENALGWSFAKGSAGTYSVGGQSNITCPLGQCESTEKQTIVLKNGKLPYLEAASGMGFAAYYKWSKDKKKLIVSLDVNITDVGVEYESTMTCPGIPPSKVGKSFVTTMGIHNLLDPLSRLEFILDDKFTITSGNKSRSLGGPPAECRGTVQTEFKAQWSTSAAAFPANKDTEARIGQ